MRRKLRALPDVPGALKDDLAYAMINESPAGLFHRSTYRQLQSVRRSDSTQLLLRSIDQITRTHPLLKCIVPPSRKEAGDLIGSRDVDSRKPQPAPAQGARTCTPPMEMSCIRRIQEPDCPQILDALNALATLVILA